MVRVAEACRRFSSCAFLKFWPFFSRNSGPFLHEFDLLPPQDPREFPHPIGDRRVAHPLRSPEPLLDHPHRPETLHRHLEGRDAAGAKVGDEGPRRPARPGRLSLFDWRRRHEETDRFTVFQLPSSTPAPVPAWAAATR